MAARAACQISVRVRPLPSLKTRIERRREATFVTPVTELRLRTPMTATARAADPANRKSTASMRTLSRKAANASRASPSSPANHAPRVKVVSQHAETSRDEIQ